MEHQKVLLQVLILLLGFSYVLSLVTATDPLSRSLKLAVEDSSTTQDLVVQGYNFMEGISRDNYGEKAVLEEEAEEELGLILHGRMVAESNDYPGTGANNNHDPKPPGS